MPKKPSTPNTLIRACLAILGSSRRGLLRLEILLSLDRIACGRLQPKSTDRDRLIGLLADTVGPVRQPSERRLDLA